MLASLDRDPRIPDSLEIAVEASGGAVTLRGTVESFRQRRAAAEDANKVEGVYDVDNQLKVSLSGEDRRDDDEIRGIALQGLIWASRSPRTPSTSRSTTTGVTIKGDGSYQFESNAAYRGRGRPVRRRRRHERDPGHQPVT